MKKCTEYTIGKTRIIQEYDPDPDTSYLGEYSNKYQPGCIIRADGTFYEDHINDEEYEPPEMNREYSFFIPPDNGEKIGSAEYRKYAIQDYELMEGLNNNQWTFIILTVKTHITTNTGLSDTIQNSLCGIADHWDKESRDHKEEVIRDLIGENKTELLKMGFSEDEIKESLDNPVYPKDW